MASRSEFAHTRRKRSTNRAVAERNNQRSGIDADGEPARHLELEYPAYVDCRFGPGSAVVGDERPSVHVNHPGTNLCQHTERPDPTANFWSGDNDGLTEVVRRILRTICDVALDTEAASESIPDTEPQSERLLAQGLSDIDRAGEYADFGAEWTRLTQGDLRRASDQKQRQSESHNHTSICANRAETVSGCLARLDSLCPRPDGQAAVRSVTLFSLSSILL